MNRAQPLKERLSLLPLPRPLMTGEVLDAAFRLFRAGLLRCLPYSGLAVLVLEMPALYHTFFLGQSSDVRMPVADRLQESVVGAAAPSMPHIFVAYLLAILLGIALFGVITLRLQAVSRGQRPRFRTEISQVIRRWPTAVIATLGALGFPAALVATSSAYQNALPTEAMLVVIAPVLWPTALLILALPAFWCDGLGPFASIAQSLRISVRRSWRMFGTLLAAASMVAVFYALAWIILLMLSPLMGRADLFLLATVSSTLYFVLGVFGVPFILAVLVVAYEDLKLRHALRREVQA
jgi:hypothetical protein